MESESKREKMPPGVYRHHGKLWISYYITGADGARVQKREGTDCTSRESKNRRRKQIASTTSCPSACPD